jgi:predicted Fe-Mo cluster-binding NifX family protein
MRRRPELWSVHEPSLPAMRAVEIRQQRGSSLKMPSNSVRMKEATGTVIDELVVLNNVELMLIANIGDLGDQAFGIRANGAQELFFVHFGVAWG